MVYPIIRPTLPDFSEVEADLRAIWSSGMLTTGRVVGELEAMVAGYCGVEHCVAMSSCTSGLVLTVKALGLSGEVILPSFTFAATGHALVWNGIEPVFVDCLPGTYNIDPEAARAAITPRTTGIVGVYVFGVPPELGALESLAAEHGLALMFDSAQALGATWQGRRAGGFGRAEVFSMSPTKVITAAEGGLVTTNDGALAGALRQMRDYGKSADGYEMAHIGLNARQSELHAAVGKACMRHAEAYIGHRLAMIARYQAALSGLPGVSFQHVGDDRTGSGNYMVMRVSGAEARLSRDGLYEALAERGIHTKKYFYPPLHLHAAYGAWRQKYEGRLPQTERLSQEGIAIPLYGHIAPEDCDIIAAAIRDLLG